jgi:hemolysin III
LHTAVENSNSLEQRVFYTRSEEFFHAVTHGAGAILAALGAVYLVTQALGQGDPWRVASFAIYGTTLVLLYTASALYHAVGRLDLKAKLRVLDHSAIYLLIAGSYTPFLLLRLWGPWGWSLLAMVWTVALAGIIYKLTLLDRFPRFSTLSYIAMGWLALAAIGPLFHRLAPATLAWVVAGGVIYTSGTLIYHLQRVRYHHVVWHMFVLAGSVCHFVAIARL